MWATVSGLWPAHVASVDRHADCGASWIALFVATACACYLHTVICHQCLHLAAVHGSCVMQTYLRCLVSES